MADLVIPTHEHAGRAIERPRRRLARLSAAGALVLAAMLVGGALRFANLGGVPPALNQDEVVNGYDAYSLFVTGRDHLGHPFPFAGLESFGDWASPLLTFLTILPVGLFGLRAEVVRMVPAAAGVLAIPIVYRLGVELFERRAAGVAAAWLVAISPWHVHRSRYAIPPAIVPTMVALTLLALVWTMRRGSARGAVALALCAGLTVASYPTMKLYVPLLLLAGLVVYRREAMRLNREALLYAALVLAIVAGPILYLSLADPGGRARLDQVSIFQSPDVGPALLLRQYRAYFSPWVFFVAGNGHPGQAPDTPGFGVELRWTLPLLLAGGAWVLGAALARGASERRRAAWLLLAALALYPVPGSLTLPTPPLTGPHLSRAIHLIPLLALFGGAGAVALLDQGRRVLDRRPGWPARGLAALLLVGAAGLIGQELLARYRDYFFEYPRREHVLRYYQYGLAEALAYARAHADGYDEIWVAGAEEPYIYELFYNRWPPSEVHRDLQLRRAPPDFNQIEAIGKYRFGDAPAFTSGLPVLYAARDPLGQAAYEVRGGLSPENRRVLLVRPVEASAAGNAPRSPL